MFGTGFLAFGRGCFVVFVSFGGGCSVVVGGVSFGGGGCGRVGRRRCFSCGDSKRVRHSGRLSRLLLDGGVSLFLVQIRGFRVCSRLRYERGLGVNTNDLFIVNIRCNWREGRVERDSNVCPDHRSHTSITFNIIFCSNSDRNRNSGGGKCLQS